MGGNQADGGAAALFGSKGDVVWVAEDAFVTRINCDVLVERWIGSRVVSIIVSEASDGLMGIIWSKLNKIAMDSLPNPTP